MGKTRDLKKAECIKGTFHARMDIIEDWNSKDLTKVNKSETVDNS